jgi:hypothetical protein
VLFHLITEAEAGTDEENYRVKSHIGAELPSEADGNLMGQTLFAVQFTRSPTSLVINFSPSCCLLVFDWCLTGVCEKGVGLANCYVFCET